MSTETPQKTCTKCKEVKPINEFHKHKRGNDGFYCHCKSCCSELAKTYRINNESLLRERKKKYHKENRDKVLAMKRVYSDSHKPEKKSYDKEYYQENRDKKRQQLKEYADSHKDEKREYDRKYRLKNIKKRYAAERRRRAKKLDLQENYTEIDEKYTRELFDHKCVHCGTTENLSIDHHRPLSKGYPLSRTNAVILCRSCNSSKQNKMPEKFYSDDILSIINEKLSKPQQH